MFAGWTIAGYELNTAQTGTSENNLATLTEAVAETVGTKNKYFKNLTSFDINEVEDKNNATITFTAKWKETAGKAAVDIITPAMYGDKVNYNANGVSDWRIFLNDIDEEDGQKHVYLIAESCVSNNGLTLTSNIIKGSQAYDVHTTKIEDWGDLIKWLQKNEYWESYANGITGASAIGSPTLEQWVQSWNDKGYMKLYTATEVKEDGITRYYIGDCENPKTNNIQVKNDIGYNDNLYFSNRQSLEGSYWFAAGSAMSGSVRALAISGSVASDNAHQGNHGCRPVIKLPSNLKMTWNGTAWDIDPNQLTGAITAQNYGDKVEYNDPAGVNDWKIFLQEGANTNKSIYLISSDYVKRDLLNMDDAKVKGFSGDYNLGGVSENGLIEWLQDTEQVYWINFKNNYAEFTTGGPTLSQFVKSYNQKYGTKYTDDLSQSNFGIPEKTDDVYLPHLGRFNGVWAWLMSSRGAPGGVWGVGCDACVFNFSYAGPDFSVRPLIKLKSETILTKWDGTQWILGTK